MAIGDILELKRNCSRSRKELHAEARELMNQLAVQPLRAICLATPGTRWHWKNWKEYVAFHKYAGGLVGPGIVYVSGKHIQGTNDWNRFGVLRSDFVFHHRDGGYVRIHSGRTAESDAQPKYFPRSTSGAYLVMGDW